MRLDGRPLFRVGSADTVPADTRAASIERRLATLLANPEPLGPAQIARAETDTASRIITVSGVPVVTILPGDAADNVTTPAALAAQWATVVDSALSGAAGRRRSAWGRFGGEIQSSMRAAFSRLAESALRIVPRVLAATLVLAVFGLLAAGLRRVMRFVFRRAIDDLTVENLLKQTAYYAVWAIGLIVAIDALGFRPEAVVTGLGLTGLALGFALKDIISNFVSGILLLALRPFELGDQIVVGETEGSVERIRLRATDIRTYDGRLVLVPNAELFTSRVTNNTASPVRGATVRVHIGYDADLARALEAARAAAVATEGVLGAPPSVARVADLGESDVVLEVRFWADSRRSDFIATAAAVRRALLATFRDAGIALPNPGVRVIVPPDVGGWGAATGEG